MPRLTYSQAPIINTEQKIQNRSSRLVVDKGQIVEVSV
jgi:hypothetical protein